MYRCYLLRDGRIVKAENLNAACLDQALAAGRQLLIEQPADRGFSGIEIWHGASMLYSDAASDAGQTRGCGAVGHEQAAFVHAASDRGMADLHTPMLHH